MSLLSESAGNLIKLLSVSGNSCYRHETKPFLAGFEAVSAVGWGSGSLGDHGQLLQADTANGTTQPRTPRTSSVGEMLPTPRFGKRAHFIGANGTRPCVK